MIREIDCRSILTRTGGFLESFTHTLNPYRGCTLGGSLCGVGCYAAAMPFGPEAPWGSVLEVKRNAASVYSAQRAREGARGPVRIFCSSVTDPYLPQERRFGITRALLDAMTRHPPDRLALQTHTPGPLRDLGLLARIDCRLSVQITVETDRVALPGFPPHAYSPLQRLDALAQLKRAGFDAVGVVAPLLPLDDAEAFARALDGACTRVILDHWRLGDGSKGGSRTLRRGLPALLERAGLGEWNSLEKFEETAALFRRVIGEDRVGISRAGFNA